MENKASVKETNKLGFGYRLLCSPEFGILIPVLIMSVVTTLLNPNFIEWGNLSYIIEQSIFVGYLALGEALIIMNGEIDLSIGAAGGFVSVMVGVAASQWGVPMFVAILVGLAVGVAIGFVNGLISAKFGLTSWITTLATQFISLGLAAFLGNGKAMPLSNDAFKPQYEALKAFKNTEIPVLGFSMLFVVFIVVMVVLDVVVRRTKFGYKLRAVGGNKDAALLAGINVKNNKFIVFILAGLFAGLYGVSSVIKTQFTSLTQGSGGEFRAITCCAIGGITMSGGKGSIYGIGLGVLMFHVVNGALQCLQVDNNGQLLMVGVLLVIAVLLDILRQKIEVRKMV